MLCGWRPCLQDYGPPRRSWDGDLEHAASPGLSGPGGAAGAGPRMWPVQPGVVELRPLRQPASPARSGLGGGGGPAQRGMKAFGGGGGTGYGGLAMEPLSRARVMLDDLPVSQG